MILWSEGTIAYWKRTSDISMTCYDTKNGCLYKHWRTKWNFEGFLGFCMRLEAWEACEFIYWYSHLIPIAVLDSCRDSVVLYVYPYVVLLNDSHCFIPSWMWEEQRNLVWNRENNCDLTRYPSTVSDIFSQNWAILNEFRSAKSWKNDTYFMYGRIDRWALSELHLSVFFAETYWTWHRSLTAQFTLCYIQDRWYRNLTQVFPSFGWR